jgi:hypothetical protein
MKGNRTGKGYYQVQGKEPVAKKPLTVKLPVSMDEAVREIAGDNLASWVREAIAAKLATEQQQDMSA